MNRLERLAAEAAGCTACGLYRDATQTVFGEGPAGAAVVLMGEVPGDREDHEGHPFVGPAGRLLDDALHAVGADRSQVYLTNAVKHFKFERRGKVRIHKKPNAAEIRACRPWWEAELAALRPDALGLLGATAAQAVLGAQVRVTRDRGRWFEAPAGVAALATVHPSAVLRAQERRVEEFERFVADLAVLFGRVAAGGPRGTSGRPGGAA